ncbi:MAG: PrgI family protein [Lachnospiraceae bacterium]|nr:PrgI family protein [Lachnospiraceae bacterium]
MLNLPIESEIEVEHKVFRDFNLRQTICLAVSGVIAVIMYLIFRNWLLMVAFTAPFALLLIYLAKPGENGEKAEEVLMKFAERHYYNNQTRSYRTRNRYVPLMNEAYRRMRARDLSDKRTAGKMAALKEKSRKRRKRSQNRGIR